MRALYAATILVSIFFRFSNAQDMNFTYKVIHDHFWGAGHGQLRINSHGIAFESETDKDHSWNWTFTDIQGMKIESPTEMEIRTYEDVTWRFNQDRKFEFKLTEGEITPEVVRFLRGLLPIPMVSSVFTTPADAFYTVPAKHKHGLSGGCRGELMFSQEAIYFYSNGHTRMWLIEEIESLGRMSTLEFRVTVRENGHRNFQFQLMKPMDEQVYENLWRQVYEPESWTGSGQDRRY